MKRLTYILFLVATLGLAACNSEDLGYDVDHTAIHPLGGQYVVTVSKNGTVLTQAYVTSSTATFTLTNGKVELEGVTAPSGTVTDKISFTYTTTKDPGATYTVEGWRYTGWPEDDY